MKVRMAVLACLLMVGCALFPSGSSVPSPVESTGALHQMEGGAEGRAQARFVNDSADAGLSGVGGNFFAWGDYDGDGHEDLLVDGQRLFRNNGPPGYTFTEVTVRAGIGGSGANCGNWADFDNDGFLDLYCPSGGWSTDYDPHQDILWHNNGDGTFTNVTEVAGHVTDTFPSVAAGWGDYDRDGFVDLYVANYENASMSAYYPDVLWHNDGDGTFTNVTVTAGVDESADPKPGRGVSWCDYNNDGWPDIYVSNYRLKANYLYRNDGDGTFTEVAASAGVAGEPTNRLGQTYYGHSVGSAWSDVDNDGDFDIWVTNLAHKDAYRGPICDDSELYMNYGNATVGGISHDYDFTDIRPSSGIPAKRILGGEDELFVGCAWGDFDNDGYEDLFLPQIYNDVPYAYSFLYRNNGNNTFTDVSDESGVRVWDTYGGAWCDYDEDGDLDLITGGKGTSDINGTHEIHLYKNLLNDEGSSNWLELRLKGTKSNSAAIGARVYMSNWGTQMREVQGGMGPHSMQNSMILHFGLPNTFASVGARIEWPGGITTKLFNLETALNRIIDVYENQTLQPDICINDVRFTPDTPVDGDVVNITVSMSNIGRETSTNGSLGFWIDDVLVSRQRFSTGFTPGETRSAYYDWDTAGKNGTHYLAFWAESSDPPDDNSSNGIVEIHNFKVNPSSGGKPPVATLNAAPTYVTPGQTVFFDGSKSYDPDGSISGYEFTYGDGISSDWAQSPSAEHSYTTIGTYTASLRVRDTGSAVSTNSAQIVITVGQNQNKAPTARIASILPNPATIGDTITFTGDAWDDDGTVTVYAWTSSLSGDLSTEKAFSTAGLPAGTHTIGFRVRDDRGAWSPLVARSLDVRPPPVNRPPTATIISISPSPATAGDVVRFTGLGEDADGTVVEYRWSSSLQGVLGSGTPLSVAGLSEGVHVITLAVRDDGGAWSPDVQSRLEMRPAVEPEAPNRAPTASLSVSRSVVLVNEVFRLDGGDSTDPDGRVMEYFFDFGDGTDSNWTMADSADHAYAFPGQYVVRLKVKDDRDARSPWSREIIIEVKARNVAPPAKSLLPGMEAAAALPAALVALAVTARRRRTSD